MRNRAPTLIVYTSAKIITTLCKEKHPLIQYGSQEKTQFIQLGWKTLVWDIDFQHKKYIVHRNGSETNICICAKYN